MTQPRLTIVSQLFYPELISTGQTLTELAETLADMGIDVDVLCGPVTLSKTQSKTPSTLTHKGIKIRRVWGSHFPKLSFFGKLINHLTFSFSLFFHLLCRSSKTPLLVVTNPPFIGGIAGLINLIRGTRYIYIVFDLYPQTAVSLGVLKQGSVITWTWAKLNQFIYSQASRIVAIGRCMESVLKLDMSPKHHHKLTRIHVWGDDVSIQKQLAVTPCNPYIHQWQLSGKFVVSYSGNMGRFHDMMSIVKAAEKLKNEPNIVFLFVGDGYYKQTLIDYAKQHQLSQCYFHDYVDKAHLGSALSVAHLSIVSLLPQHVGLSVPSKTYGLLAAKVPVIAMMPAHAEIAQMIEESHCGYRLDAGDVDALVLTILHSVSQTDLLEKLGQNGRDTVAKTFSLKQAAQAYYKEILALNI
jgi:glycosyltransferase involved in cell wall biosynthesis